MLLPALVERELEGVARDHHREHPEGPAPARIVDWMGALIPRVMFPASLAAAAREAGAEPLWTGRPLPYAESTLRMAATRLDAEGAWVHVAGAVWRQVTDAVAKVDDEVVAYTDMFDQPYFTKKLAHAAPIGRLGNRLLAGTYFGLTTVALPGGPTLFAHLSWHKPASPLRDALEDLFGDDARMAWWHAHVRLHILDRGANGDAVLQWLWNWEVPYLTIGRKSADLWRFPTPTARNAHGLPFVVRPDARLDGDGDDGPWEVIVPARPDDAAGTRGLRFRAAVPLDEAALLELNAQYKSRWPSMENELKALQSRGFGRNRTRRLALTESRGTDGEIARLREQEATQCAEIEALDAQPSTPQTLRRVLKMAQQITATRAKRERLAETASRKHARVEGGAERLGKWLHLLVQNALKLALASSCDEAVRAMEPNTVFALLLSRSALTCVEDARLTLWVEALDGAEDRSRQAALVAAFNQLKLRCRGREVVVHLRERAVKVAA